jgi:hypothetical protein
MAKKKLDSSRLARQYILLERLRSALDSLEEEQHGGRHDSGRLVRDRGGSREDRHATALSDSCKDHELALYDTRKGFIRHKSARVSFSDTSGRRHSLGRTGRSTRWGSRTTESRRHR